MHERPLWASKKAKGIFEPIAARPRVGVEHILNVKDNMPIPGPEVGAIIVSPDRSAGLAKMPRSPR